MYTTAATYGTEQDRMIFGEKSDHLGNVRAVVSDIRKPASTTGSIDTWTWQADITDHFSYYPFGMLEPGRQKRLNTVDAGGYKFSFNGKLRDDSWHSAAGTVYDYGFRIYDARIAKFLSVDPLSAEYPWYTPYQFAGNKPIWAIDLDGLEEYYYWYSAKLNTRDNQPKVTFAYQIEEKGNPTTGKMEKIKGEKWFLLDEKLKGDHNKYEYSSEKDLKKNHLGTLNGLFKIPVNLDWSELVKVIIDIAVQSFGGDYAKAANQGLQMGEKYLDAISYSERVKKLGLSVVSGSFKSESNAIKRMEELNELGYNAKVLPVIDDRFYRVSIGEYQYSKRGDALKDRNKFEDDTEEEAWLLITEKEKLGVKD